MLGWCENTSNMPKDREILVCGLARNALGYTSWYHGKAEYDGQKYICTADYCAGDWVNVGQWQEIV